jgi:hypothetical protein
MALCCPAVASQSGLLLMKSRPCRVRLDPLQQASVDGSRNETTEAMS